MNTHVTRHTVLRSDPHDDMRGYGPEDTRDDQETDAEAREREQERRDAYREDQYDERKLMEWARKPPFEE